MVEGTSDDHFLSGLVGRVLRDIGLSAQGADFDVAEPVCLVRCGERPFTSFARQVSDMRPLPSLVFLHFDTAGSLERESDHAFVPMTRAWASHDLPEKTIRLLPLAPVREMESWALADLDEVNRFAGRDVRRSKVFERELINEVERLSDPKKTLDDALRSGSGRRGRRQRMAAEDFFPVLAERIRLDQLGRVPSFARWRADTVAALHELGFLR
ncbi:DUF4276 family protein [Actinoalloteichus sp. GBA129-24]|uniref:DUF4276 family protein n=1 Tax=Actinoalloteichus sp. GBA129-24 TaxID=1612551 RepID=UPI000951C0F2|nr:DUF4276 family protein [Actinoalloteichus sp. GBA129-24]